MRKKIATITDVAENSLCTGCGVSAYLEPGRIEMVDDLDQGRRPLVSGDAGSSADTVGACPGRGLRRPDREPGVVYIEELYEAWGPIIEMWEGHATDPEIRFAGSSGGVATALGLWGVESKGMAGVLHIAARPDAPYLNHTIHSTSRAELMAATGSRYAPASPCDRLDLVEQADAPSVFFGKPCDVAATRSARDLRPGLDEKLGLTVAIFSAGTPNAGATMKMIDKLGSSPETVSSVRYRGNGWPGLATVVDESGHRDELTYAESWGNELQMHRQWRCYVCLDHTGEFADVSVGDPWYRDTGDDPGRSLVLVRTERGQRAVRAAMESGYLTLERVEPEILPASQPNLLRDRGAVWARTTTTRLMGTPTPRYENMPSFTFWLRGMSFKDRAQAFYGTVRRVFRKRLRDRHPVVAHEPVSRTTSSTPPH